MAVYRCYTDIGKSGTHFQRAGFERMMEDVKNRRINCIVVKDLSRFARNHIEAGNYIEKIFPFLEVRFIAVTDHFDSFSSVNETEIWSVHLKNLMNEMYAKDISRKVKSVKQEKKRQGNFTGGIPPYGFAVQYDGEGRQLVREKETAALVRQMFIQYLSGRSCKEIGAWLYERRVLPPAKHQQMGRVYAKADMEVPRWTAATIKHILNNSVYIVPYRGETAEKECTSVITEAMFAAVQGQKKTEKTKKKNTETIIRSAKEDRFAERIFCGKCGKKMYRVNGKKTVRYRCLKKEKNCRVLSISDSVLEQILTEAFRRILSERGISQEKLQEIQKTLENEKEKRKLQKLEEFEKRKKKTEIQEGELYFQYRCGKECQEVYQRKRQEILGKRRRLENEKQVFLRKIQEDPGEAMWSGQTLEALVSEIRIFEERKIRITFAFMQQERE